MSLNLLNPLVNKARRPKFEVHLKIYDLNNVPLVNGASHIKWHLPHSIHGEHRGRTHKSPIANHRVEYNYNKLIPIRIAIDKNNSLSECLVDFEVIQEFPPIHGGPSVAGSRDEKITLGRLTLNLSEYVEESEAIVRENHGFRMRGPSGLGGGSAPQTTQQQQQQLQQQNAPHARKASSASETSSPKSLRKSIDTRKSIDQAQAQTQATAPAQPDDLVEEGVIRRYLLTDAKINSTLKISLLVVQIDGERTFTAPPLKTAAVFGGIGGMTGSSTHPAAEDFGQHFQDAHPEQDSANLSAQFTSSAGPGRDLYEVQDMYRRALAASWACQPGELPPDECIEDIFAGGDGFGPDGVYGSGPGDVTPRGPSRKGLRREDSESSPGEPNEFLRPGDALKGSAGGAGGRRYHVRQGSGESVNTLRNDGRPGSAGGMSVKAVESVHHRPMHRREASKDSSLRGGNSGVMRRDSLASLNGSGMEIERGRSGFKSAREVTEREIREDFVAWKLPAAV
ncbi:hypothetical protein N0V82_008640 [Gnomoniopsis sp. IMI 355080]|nr:hypothetical protein N0V82_008640 [Gnomoniopsis sp. IMI 355080]